MSMSKNIQMKFPEENERLVPGYRFHPTDIELFVHYLTRKVLGKPLQPEPIIEVELYQYHPEDLRIRACKNSSMDLYFFCARGKKYGCGERINRVAQFGYWKATGKDKVVLYRQRIVGKIKHLVFHEGKPTKGVRTDWVMHEYRLEDCEVANKDAFVLCKIFKKDGLGPRNREQFGSVYNEEEWDKEEEVTNNAPMVPVVDQGQGGAVSIPDQAPALSANASNVASTSKAVVSNSDIASTSKMWDKEEELTNNAPMVPVSDQAPALTANASNVAPTSKAPVQIDDHDHDEIMAKLDHFYVVDDAYGNLLDSIPAHVCPLYTLQQFYPGAASDHAPGPTADRFNVASTSMAVVSNSGDVVDQGPVPTSYYAAIVSTPEYTAQKDDDLDMEALLKKLFVEETHHGFGNLDDPDALNFWENFLKP